MAVSECPTVLSLLAVQLVVMTNATFSESSGRGVCNIALKYLAKTALFHSVRISTFGLSAIIAIPQYDGGILVQFTECTFENASELLNIELITLVTMENVTFQYASGTVPVTVSTASCTFRNCTWRHNQGSQAGALIGLDSPIMIVDCQFFNNTSETGPGDLLFQADDSEFSIKILNSSFEASKSSFGPASVLFAAFLLDAEMFGCTISSAYSLSNGVITTSHGSGRLILRNLTFLGIDAPSTSLILINTASASLVSPAHTVLEFLQVHNNRFFRGVVTQSTSKWSIITSRSNHFAGNQGLVLWLESGHWQDQGSVFEANTEGLYFQSTNTTAEFADTKFIGNSPSEEMAMLYIEGPSASASFQNCEFLDNHSPYYTEIMQLEKRANVTFLNSFFRGNQASSAFLAVNNASMYLQNCSFSHSSDVFHLNKAHISITNSLFDHISSTLGLITLIDSSLHLRNSILLQLSGSINCLFSGLQSNVTLTEVHMYVIDCERELVSLKLGSALSIHQSSMDQISTRTTSFTLSQCNLELSNVQITTVRQAHTLISLTEVSASLRNVTVTGSESLLIQGIASTLVFEGCEFTDVWTQSTVGVLDCSKCLNISITNTKLEHISAASVGGLSIDSTQFLVSYSEFRNIQAQNSGALSISAPSILISHCLFHSNSATGQGSSGGGARLSGANSRIEHSTFERNSAVIGGALHWKEAAPYMLNVLFVNNSATYGPDQASEPDHLESDKSVYNLVSGQLYVGEVRVFLKDRMGQTVVTNSVTSATLTGTVMKGVAKAVAQRGELIFRGFAALAAPVQHYVVVTAGKLTLNVTFQFRSCELGEVQVGLACVNCPIQQYSLNISATECGVCPTGGECPGDGHLYPSPGYWRPNTLYSGVFDCLRKESCLGHVNHTSATGICEELYTGNLCQDCAEGAHRNGQNRCKKCPGNVGIRVQAALLSIALPLLWLGLGLICVKTKGNTRVLLRIFLNYVQLTVLVTDFDLGWSSVVEYFFLFHHYLGNTVQQFLPIGCLTQQIFYVNVVGAALAPVALIGLFSLLWIVLRVLAVASVHPSNMISPVIVGLVYLHTFILRISLSAFQCRTLEPGQHWLLADMTVRCWDKHHLVYTLTVALPTTVIWGVGLPALALLLLTKRRKTLYEEHSQVWTGFLCAGFKDHYYYWELTMLLCKAFIAVLYVFTADMAAFTQALLLSCLLSVFGILQLICAPYRAADLGRVELGAVAVVLCTVYMGLHFDSTDHSAVFTALLLAFHLWFGVEWVRACGCKLTLQVWNRRQKPASTQ